MKLSYVGILSLIGLTLTIALYDGSHHIAQAQAPIMSRQTPVSTPEDTARPIFSTENIENVRRIQALEGKCCSIAFSPNNRVLATKSPNGIILYNLDNFTASRDVIGVYSPDDLAFNPSGSFLVSVVGNEGEVQIWRNLRRDNTFEQRGYLFGWSIMTYASFNSDGSLIATTSFDGQVRLWNFDQGVEIRKIQKGYWPSRPSFSTDNTLLAWSSDYGSGEGYPSTIWDIRTGRIVKELADAANPVFSPTGTVMAHSSHDGRIYLRNTRSWAITQEMEGHTDYVTSIIFSPDGTLLISGSADKTIRIWNVDTGEMLKVLRDHQNDVANLTMSQDGTLLASAGRDTRVGNNPRPNPDELFIWAVSSSDATAEPTQAGDYTIGQRIRYIGDTTRNLRQDPNTNGRIVGSLQPMELVTVIDGPSMSGGYIWWLVRTQNDSQGWVADNTGASLFSVEE